MKPKMANPTRLINQVDGRTSTRIIQQKTTPPHKNSSIKTIPHLEITHCHNNYSVLTRNPPANAL